MNAAQGLKTWLNEALNQRRPREPLMLRALKPWTDQDPTSAG